MATKTVKCPLCGFAPSRLYDIDEETASDQGNGKPKFECMRVRGCGLIIQTETIEGMRTIFKGTRKEVSNA